MKKIRFITIEGVDGGGKTLGAKKLAERLRRAGGEVVLTRTAGGTVPGLELRRLILDPDIGMTPRARFLCFAADMVQVSEQVILPAIKMGKMVISDRFADSTRVYQVLTVDGLDLNERQLRSVILRQLLPIPDLTFFLDVTPEEACRRMGRRDLEFTAKDVFEAEGDSKWKERRTAYKTLAKLSAGRIVTIDTTELTSDGVVDRMVDRIDSLNERKVA